MVPTEAYRDEGTSYHYAPASDYITVKNSEKVAEFMELAGLPYVKGKHGLQMLYTVRPEETSIKERMTAAFR